MAESLLGRAGRPTPKQAREDISPALKAYFEGWLKRWLYDGPEGSQRASAVATALDIPAQSGGGVGVFGHIMDHVDKGDSVAAFLALTLSRGERTTGQ